MCTLYFFYIEAVDLLQKLSLESQNKGLDISEPAKVGDMVLLFVWIDCFLLIFDCLIVFLVQLSVNSDDVTNGQNQSFDRSLTPVLPEFMDPNMCYMPSYASYYYGGINPYVNWKSAIIYVLY